MPFIKVQKNSAYFKRYQTQYRRRIQCKTDYHARRKLVAQDKFKYSSPRYRLVVRVTNHDVITQVVFSKVVGDFVLASAYAHELPEFGATVGLTNYSACYATGLLLARRLMSKFKMDKLYGAEGPAAGEEGEDTQVEATDNRRPFKALLDVGLARTTTGARIFAAMKGALDGGLNVPHSESRFAGFNKEKGELNTKAHRDRIFGNHVAAYRKKLSAEEDKKLFSRYVKAKVAPEAIEKMWAATHKAIRANPNKKAAPKKAPQKHRVVKVKKALTTAQKQNKHVQKRHQLQKL